MSDIIIKTIAGTVGTIGFALIFRMKPRLLPFAAINGLAACIVYFGVVSINNDVFLSNLCAALVVAALSELFAVIKKAPSTVFLLPGCIVLVPGGTLYYTMSNLISQNYDAAFANLLLTVKVGIAIGGGIIASAFLRYSVSKIVNAIRTKKKA